MPSSLVYKPLIWWLSVVVGFNNKHANSPPPPPPHTHTLLWMVLLQAFITCAPTWQRLLSVKYLLSKLLMNYMTSCTRGVPLSFCLSVDWLMQIGWRIHLWHSDINTNMGECSSLSIFRLSLEKHVMLPNMKTWQGLSDLNDLQWIRAGIPKFIVVILLTTV